MSIYKNQTDYKLDNLIRTRLGYDDVRVLRSKLGRQWHVNVDIDSSRHDYTAVKNLLLENTKTLIYIRDSQSKECWVSPIDNRNKR